MAQISSSMPHSKAKRRQSGCLNAPAFQRSCCHCLLAEVKAQRTFSAGLTTYLTVCWARCNTDGRLMNLDLLDWSILAPAMITGLLVLSTHVPLGQEVLKR